MAWMILTGLGNVKWFVYDCNILECIVWNFRYRDKAWCRHLTLIPLSFALLSCCLVLTTV